MAARPRKDQSGGVPEDQNTPEDDPRPRCGVEGERTPEYLAWLKRNDPDEYRAACARCGITPDDA